MRKSITLLLILYCSLSWGKTIIPDQTVWYTYPAKNWSTQALHLGNGYMGASFYGDVKQEKLDIAEKTFWVGGPSSVPDFTYGINPGGKENIDKIRQLVLEQKYAEADSMCDKFMSGNATGYGYFSNVGSLIFNFSHPADSVTDYIRGVNLADGYGFVRYKSNEVNYSRTYFCNYPDQVMALNFSADRKGHISFNLEHPLTYAAKEIEFTKENEWVIKGNIDGNNMQYVIRMRIETIGGTISYQENSVSVANADEAHIFYAVDTEYTQNYPTYRGENPEQTTRQIMASIASKGYDKIYNNHLADYHKLYNRVHFNLIGDPDYALLPTDQRIAHLKKGFTDDSQLKALWFNYGRYMIISASRENTLPSNLQGVWNTFKKAPWNGNYQSNINLQEMYWSCGPTNLPECELSYLQWIKNLVPSGRKTAEAYYGTKGWVSHSIGNIWGYTAPGRNILFGLYPSGAAWHCRHLWEHYAFTHDRNYLKEVYPILKEAGEFWLNNLVEYGDHLIVTPSVSAEHGIEVDGQNNLVTYSTRNGENARQLLTVPAYQDIEMVYNLFSDICKAMDVLQTDEPMKKEIQHAMSRMLPLKIGKYGQLQEWILDTDNPRDHHRHLAHLYAMFPGDMISTTNNPELSAGVRKSLQLRGYGKFGDKWPHTGGNWSMMWRIALWTRLGEGDIAMDAFNTLIKESGYENMASNQSDAFQVDATMATPGIFTEMLLQSHDGTINLLPAIPTEWPEGEIKGVVARGGYIVDIAWKNGSLTEAIIHIPQGVAKPVVRIRNKEATSNVQFIRM